MVPVRRWANTWYLDPAHRRRPPTPASTPTSVTAPTLSGPLRVGGVALGPAFTPFTGHRKPCFMSDHRPVPGKVSGPGCSRFLPLFQGSTGMVPRVCRVVLGKVLGRGTRRASSARKLLCSPIFMACFSHLYILLLWEGILRTGRGWNRPSALVLKCEQVMPEP